jgi:glycosyltransferase involved in cell wall biosynthesis
MPLRVLAVAQAAELGGAEFALLRVAPHLAEAGIELELAVPHEGGVSAAARGIGVHDSAVGPPRSGRDSAAARGIAVHELPIGPLRAGGWPRAVAAWPRARALVRRTRPDVVWLNGIVPQRLVPALGGVPALLHLHDLVERPPRPWRSERFWRRVPVVACASQAVADAAIAAGAPRERVGVAPVPIEPPERAPRPDWADGRPVVGFVGRIEPRKGVLDLLAAARTLVERRPEVRIVIVRGPDIDADRAYQCRFEDEAAALGEAVVVVGPLARASALMPWFDVLCVPSLNEPFGTVAAEALAAGTPAVVTDSGGMPEYVVAGESGDVVPPGDPDALARSLERTLERAPQMAAAARAAAARFSPDRAAAAMARLLHEAAGR